METNFTGNGLLLTALSCVHFLKAEEMFFFWEYKCLFYMAGGSSWFRFAVGKKKTLPQQQTGTHVA